ncbi:MAG: hypothetical protein ABI981_04910 [Betaproteobacteria bacterium]
MTRSRILAFVALLGALCAFDAHADRSTVCTVTVNSPDEREILRKMLPAERFGFVELVERGRPDWLASACRQGVRCDVLVISGHFDGGTEFYSDRVDARESLPVEELERASCSQSCSGLFSQLKEVYLFGCNTLNPATVESTAAEVSRSLVRAGYAQADAEQVARTLNASHGESNRDGMRRIFADVPVIYGFPGQAPLGASAGPTLGRYLQATSSRDVATGRASSSLLGAFASSSMSVAAGMSRADPRADYRRDVCQFFDEGLSPAQRLAFIHGLLNREMAEVRMFFERIEAFDAALSDEQRAAPDFVRELDRIASDEAARDRYLGFARDVDRPAVRARMIHWAMRLGWLTSAQENDELARLVAQMLAGHSISSAEVELICSLNRERELERSLAQGRSDAPKDAKVAHSAALACLGQADERERVLGALTSREVDDVDVAQVYLRHRPISDVRELRAVATAIARMTETAAQVRALDTLAHYYLSDHESLAELARLFPRAASVGVQRAIAGVFIRSDYRAVAQLDLVRVLRRYRIKSPDGEDMIDVLIRRLQA